MRHTGRADAPTFIEFCGRLLHDDGGPVFFIVDRHPIHTAAEVTTFAAATEGRLRLFYLPTYSPELNPDEWSGKT